MFLPYSMNVPHPCGPSSLVVDLRTQYRRDTVGLCNSISEALVTTLGSLSDNTGKVVRKVITRTQLNFLSEVAVRRIMFIGRIANELSTSATVFDNLDCEPVTLDGGRMSYTAFMLHTKLFLRRLPNKAEANSWKGYVTTTGVEYCRSSRGVPFRDFSNVHDRRKR